MELIYIDLEHPNNLIPDQLVATIGQFDGLHRGHLVLFKKALEIGKNKSLKTAVITFDPHPDFVLGKSKDFSYVTPINEKKQLLERLGFDYLLIVKFSFEVAKLEPAIFVKKYLLDLNIKEVVVGFDFGFGDRGKGKPQDITPLSDGIIHTTIVEEVKYQNEKIGTEKIKKLIALGKVDEVKEWLGRYYTISGMVMEGNKIGRTLKIPTANIMIKDDFVKVLPGVYAVMVECQKKSYIGIANIGHNPSFNYRPQSILEVNILDFDKYIYGDEIAISFIKYLRPEKVFDSKEAFQRQIDKDRVIAKELVSPLLSNC